MIKAHCFTKEWIDSFRRRKAYSKINPPLLEKMIQALYLLQQLQVQGLPFIFKGGTSLILLLQNSNRFSVDIDIITEENRATIEAVLDRVVGTSHFKAWKLDEKRSYQPGVPKAHYELEYDSSVNINSNYILLDILFEKAHYSHVRKRVIKTQWIETEEDISIDLPTVEAIAGDKLTAFAPTTTGILYGKGKELEIIKQLFDLGNLFDEITQVEDVLQSFNAFAVQEIAYRNLDIRPENILKDTLSTCRLIAQRERTKDPAEKAMFSELQSGIRSFGNFLITGHFRIDEAVTAAAKVAYLCAKLLRKDTTNLVKYADQDLQQLTIINQDWNWLNRLKKFPDQSAFFYWYQCLATLGELE